MENINILLHVLPKGAYGLVLIALLITAFAIGKRLSDDIDKRFNFEDWFLGIDGKASLAQASFFLVVMVMTWGFVYLVIADKLTEWYMFTYGSIGTAAYLGSKSISKNSLPTIT